ncbi:unnamed protein product, partial [Rotaria sp. Silwood2]
MIHFNIAVTPFSFKAQGCPEARVAASLGSQPFSKT